jgi:hypothetical protein
VRVCGLDSTDSRYGPVAGCCIIIIIIIIIIIYFLQLGLHLVAVVLTLHNYNKKHTR